MLILDGRCSRCNSVLALGFLDMLPKRGGAFPCTHCSHNNSLPWHQYLVALAVAFACGFATGAAVAHIWPDAGRNVPVIVGWAFGSLAYAAANVAWFQLSNKPFSTFKPARTVKRSLLWKLVVYILLPFGLVGGAFALAISAAGR